MPLLHCRVPRLSHRVSRSKQSPSKPNGEERFAAPMIVPLVTVEIAGTSWITPMLPWIMGASARQAQTRQDIELNLYAQMVPNAVRRQARHGPNVWLLPCGSSARSWDRALI